MGMDLNTQTRMYWVRKPPHGPWARIWITDDGCISTISDHGNWGYWFGAPGMEFRKFLCRCPDDYLIGKFSGGETEFDGDRTVRVIRERIVQWRRNGSLSLEEAAYEWNLVHPHPGRYYDDRGRFSNMDSRVEAHEWYCATHLPDAAELMVYRPPIQLLMFMEHLWPVFIEQLKAELEREADLYRGTDSNSSL